MNRIGLPSDDLAFSQLRLELPAPGLYQIVSNLLPTYACRAWVIGGKDLITRCVAETWRARKKREVAGRLRRRLTCLARDAPHWGSTGKDAGSNNWMN